VYQLLATKYVLGFF